MTFSCHISKKLTKYGKNQNSSALQGGILKKKKNAGDKAKHTYIAGSKDLFTWNLLVL
jgi:hypothetical protein